MCVLLLFIINFSYLFPFLLFQLRLPFFTSIFTSQLFNDVCTNHSFILSTSTFKYKVDLIRWVRGRKMKEVGKVFRNKSLIIKFLLLYFLLYFFDFFLFYNKFFVCKKNKLDSSNIIRKYCGIHLLILEFRIKFHIYSSLLIIRKAIIKCYFHM
jgi:hypothetical protein